MYAIVEIAGQQFKVEKGKKIFIHHLEAETGKTIDFDKVLLIDDDGKITIGEPVIKDAIIEGKIIDHVKGDKVIVFKKKRRKGYKVTKGHRQHYTRVEILSINEKRQPKKVQEKTETVPAGAESTLAEKSTARKQPAAKKTATTKKPATKKPATKKPATKKPAAKKPAAKKTTAKKTTEKKTTKGKTSK